MNVRQSLALGLGLVCWLAIIGVCQAQETPNKTATPSPLAKRTDEIYKALQTEIDTEAFKGARPLQDFLTLLTTTLKSKHLIDLPLFFNGEAFRSPNPEFPKVGDTVIEHNFLPKTMTVSMLLSATLDQFPARDGAMIVRQGVLEITTFKLVDPAVILRQQLVSQFKDVPVRDALTRLSQQTGVSITLDEKRAAKELSTPVSASFTGNSSVYSGITTLADSAGLSAVIMGEGIYVTTSDHALDLDRLKLLGVLPQPGQ